MPDDLNPDSTPADTNPFVQVISGTALDAGIFDDPWLLEQEAILRAAQHGEKMGAEESAAHAVKQGHVLNGVVERKGYKTMVAWVVARGMYCERSANYYRALARSGMSTATIAAMTIRGAAESAPVQFDEAEDGTDPVAQGTSGTSRRGRQGPPSTRAPQSIRLSGPAVSEVPEWSRPTQEGEVLTIRWTGLKGANPLAPTHQLALVWAVAEGKYKWIFLQYDGLEGRTNGYKGHREVSGAKGEDWGRVQTRLNHWYKLAHTLVENGPLRDAINLRTVEILWIALKMEQVSQRDLAQYIRRDIGRHPVRQNEEAAHADRP